MILCLGATPAVQRVMFFSRLALDAVNRARTTLEGAAGKSINVAKVLKALGEQPLATGFLGGDRGEFLRHVLEARQIDMDFVAVPERTRECLTVIDEASGGITELVEESRSVAPSHYEELMDVVRRHLPHCRALVMSGTLTPGGRADFYRRCAELADSGQILTLVDAKGDSLVAALPARPAVVKPNRAELAATFGAPLPEERGVMAAMRNLCERGAQRVVVTAGKEPTVAFDGERFWRIHSPQISAVNPIGSGDAFTAALVWKLAQGTDLGEACRWGAAAGAANALTPMPGEFRLEDVHRLAAMVKVERA